MPTARKSRARRRSTALSSAGLVAAGAFAALTLRATRRKTSRFDWRARSRLPSPRKRETKATARALGHVGKGWFQMPLGFALAAYMAGRGRRSAALTLAGVSAAAYGLAGAFDHWLPHRVPPPRRSPLTPSYPSGHTLRSTAVMSTAAYLASRERLVDWRLALAPGAVVGPLAGLDRVYLDRHWLTDVVGGWLAAMSLAALSAGVYELTRNDASERA